MLFYELLYDTSVRCMFYLNLIREKFIRFAMGFGYLMYPHSLVPVIDPWGSGRDKVGIRALITIVELWNIVLYFSFTTAILG